MENLRTKSFTRREWCELRGVSNSYYWRMKKLGTAPKSYKVGNQERITPEADAEWMTVREAASAKVAA